MKQWLYAFDEKVPVLVNTRTISQIRPSRLNDARSIVETLDGQTYVVESDFEVLVIHMEDDVV